MISKTMICISVLVLLAFSVSASATWKKADFDNNGCIDMGDFCYLANYYGSEKGDDIYRPHYDLHKDFMIDDIDIAVFNSYYGMGDCP